MVTCLHSLIGMGMVWFDLGLGKTKFYRKIFSFQLLFFIGFESETEKYLGVLDASPWNMMVVHWMHSLSDMCHLIFFFSFFHLQNLSDSTSSISIWIRHQHSSNGSVNRTWF